MGFLHFAATTRSSTPSPSRSPTNCGGPATREQLSPNCFWMNASVTAGEGDLARAGGGGGVFWAAAEMASAVTHAARAGSINLRDFIVSTLVRFDAHG